jgi:23S rRNA (uracil1939-C5)-methyltransferase
MSPPPPRRGPPRPNWPQSRPQQGPRELLTVTPDAWTTRGEAIVYGDKPLLVWAGIPGEKSLVRLQHEGMNQGRARWVEARSPHPVRVQPPCDRYDLCGGCPLMHLNGEGQDRARRALLRDTFKTQGLELEDGVVESIVGSPLGASGFRHVVKVMAGWSDHGHPRFGAPSRGTRSVVPIPECLVITPVLREVMKKMAYLAIDHDLRPWTDDGQGVVRWMIARQSSVTGEVLVTLVAGRSSPGIGRWAEALSGEHAAVTGIHLHLNEGPGNGIFGRDGQGLVGTTNLLGGWTIPERLNGVNLRVGPGDFYQTNPAVANLIARDLVQLAQIKPGVPVVDLYCGVGGFTLVMAKQAGWALGVESNEGAVRRAKESAQVEHIPAEFIAAEVAEAAPALAQRLAGRRPVVLVNPARRGLEDGVAEAIRNLRPRRVLYLSCNPTALARDLRGFQAEGWRVTHIRPYDMFPNTAHLEVLAVLEAPVVPEDEDEELLRAPQRRRVRA